MSTWAESLVRAWASTVTGLPAMALRDVIRARPMTTVKTPKREGTVILAVDVSNSMRADDIKPTRMDAAKVIRRRSLVVLVSDFISEPGWERSLLRLSERHEVVAVRLVDPREFDLPDAGLIVVEDAETGEQLTIDSSDPEFRRRLRQAGEEREREIRAAARRAGVDLHVITTDDDLVMAFVRIVQARKRMTRR